MTRAQFLNDLYRLLAGNGMNAEQAEQHLTYYAEMLADRMEEGMAEEQAVASMEDVDIIARRILEEEGLAYRPLKEIPMTPPAYPDASKLGGGGGTRAYQVPRKRDWRRMAQVALWALAIVLALGAVSRWFWMRQVRNYSMPDPVREALDTTDYAVAEEVAPYLEWYDLWDIPYEYGYEYTSGTNEITSSAVNSIDQLDIEWAAGTVSVQSWTGESIQIMEYAHSELTERTAMRVECKDGKLSIRFRNGTSLGSVKGDKWLVVLLPDGVLEELEIETTSADVWLNNLEQGELDVSTSSGEVSLTECYFQKADLETISGDVYISSVYGEELEVSTTSGYVSGDAYCNEVKVETTSGDINLDTAENTDKAKMSTISGDVWLHVQNLAFRSISMSSTSGDIFISIPYDMGFTLDYSTVSGDLSNNFDFDMVKQNGKYVYNGGGCEIKVDTVSGSLDIY